MWRSDDAEHWTRQEGNLLQEPGQGLYDDVAGNHCDVVVRGDHAYIYYFTHLARFRGQQPREPREEGLSPFTTFIQVAELCCEDGLTLSCDRDAVTIIR